MSDESITYKEAKEDLLYIARGLNMEEFTYTEPSTYGGSKESIASLASESSSQSDRETDEKKMGNEIGPSMFKDPSVLLKTRPFNLIWTYGMNPKVDIINKTDIENNEIIFASSHFPIRYDFCAKKMYHLEGHHHTIVSISSDRNGDYLVTADNGPDGFLNIWNRKMINPKTGKLAPALSMYAIYQNYGIVTAQISPCARYLITVGSVRDDLYSIDMWLWTLGNDIPEDSYKVSSTHGYPIAVRYNPNGEENIMVIFSKQVVLLFWDKNLKKFTLTVCPQIMHRAKIGHLTMGTYVDRCHQCYTASSKGCILTFGNALYSKPFEEGTVNNNKMFINAVKISDVSVDCCTTIDELVVTGDARGRIFFFTKRLMILYWLTKFKLGPIASISFNLNPKVKHKEAHKYYVAPVTEDGIMNCEYLDKVEELEVLFRKDLPIDATLNRAPFLIKDFFVATARCNVYAVDVLNHKCVSLFHIAGGYVAAIETHEDSDYILIAFKNNRIILMNYLTNEVVNESFLPKGNDENATISCMKYNQGSLHLVCGKTNGEIWVLEPILLQPQQPEPFTMTQNRVMNIQFSVAPVQFAYFDDNRTVVIFQYNNEAAKWIFKGKIMPHYDDITDLLYVPGTDKWKLFTISKDRHLNEYNNNELDTEDFKIQSSERITQTAKPQCIVYLASTAENKLGYFLIADDKHKFKFSYQVPNLSKIVLAPAFGCFKNQLIHKIQIIPHCDAKYMVFSTNRHCGVHILPPDGNPYKYVGYLTHPIQLQDFVLSRDGEYMFTFGLNDTVVLKWSIETKAVERMRHLGGKELEPFYCLIEGGYNGWLFHEIKDLFYYMQKLQQENIDVPRRVSDTIHINELPDMLRTVGFYPSEFELDNIMVDAQFRNKDEPHKTNDDVSFTEFVKLYCNYKPVYGYSQNDLLNAFNKVVTHVNNDPNATTISKEDFIKVLTTEGEAMTQSNAFKCFRTLMRSDQVEENFDILPKIVDYSTLFEEILAIDLERDVLEPEHSYEVVEPVTVKRKSSQ